MDDGTLTRMGDDRTGLGDRERDGRKVRLTMGSLSFWMRIINFDGAVVLNPCDYQAPHQKFHSGSIKTFYWKDDLR